MPAVTIDPINRVVSNDIIGVTTRAISTTPARSEGSTAPK